MDPISLTASLIAFLQITDSVIKACKHCIDTIKDAPKDMEMILGEVMSLRAIIHGLSNTNLPSSTPSLFAQSGPVEACRRCLCALEGLVTPDDKNQKASQSKFRLKLADLSWPLKEPKARKLIAEMSQHKSTLLLAMTGDIIYDIKAIKSGVERLGRTLTDAQRQDLIQWVERTNPSSIHNAVFRKHERHTSAWLLQSSEWLTWLDNTEPARFLWIHGIPGSGKTVMASFIIENIRQLCDSDDELGHAYYYCHYSHDQDEAIPFLRWIIGKLCRQAKWVPPRLQSLHEDGSDPSIPQLEDVLGDLAEKFNTIYLVIDGVDESNPRDDLLAVVVTIAVDKRFKNIRILATSRVYFDIERMFSGISTAISMSNPLVDKDIREFVRAKLSSNYLLKRWAPIMGSIEDALVAGARGMFRWAECQIHAIGRIRDETQLRVALLNLPEDLAETYVRILENIPDADRPFIHRALLWICGHARSPWLIDQGINAKLLISAVLFDLGGTENTSNSTLYDFDYLKEMCGCLVTFADENLSFGLPQDMAAFYSKEAKSSSSQEGRSLAQDIPSSPDKAVVSLAHYTVLEFLESSFISQTTVSYFALTPQMIRSEFATSVLQQAVQADPANPSADWTRDREAYCLTLACALYDNEFSTRRDIQELFIRFLTPSSPHYKRIYSIQKRILIDDSYARAFFITQLPLHIQEMGTSLQQVGHAAILLNILLIIGADLAKAFLFEKDVREMLSMRLSTIWFKQDHIADTPELKLETLQGTIWEIMQQRNIIPSRLNVHSVLMGHIK